MRQLGSYLLDPESVRSGGMGLVFRAVHATTGAVAAVKVPRPEFRTAGGAEAFLQEGTLLMNNPHEHLVRVFDVGMGEDDAGRPLPYIVMEYLPEARSITDHSRRRAWKHERRLDAFLEACEAVRHLHERGITHFDLKPSNILIDAQEHVKVMDLGVARLLHQPHLSLPGGTYQYMSPEQLSGDAVGVGHPCDAYALGMLLFELMSGRLAYYIPRDADRSRAFEIASSAPVPRLRTFDPCLRGRIEHVAEHALAKDPADRPSVADMIDATRRAQDALPRDRMARRALRLMLAAVIVIVAAMLAPELGASLLGPMHQQWAQWLSGRSAHAGALQHTAVIAIRDDTNVAAIAAERGLEGVSAKNPSSLRRLHGELCRALARSSAKCAVFDIKFRAPTEFDADFASGMRSLHDAGIPVVLAAPSFWPDANGSPEISPALWRECSAWGYVAIELPGDELWTPLAVQRADEPAFPSLSMAAYAAAQAQGAYFGFTPDVPSGSVRTDYWMLNPDRPDVRVPARTPDYTPATRVESFDPGVATLGLQMGLQPGDILAEYRPDAYKLPRLREATVPYQDVLSADAVTLARWFAGRVVIIGDFTSAQADATRRSDGTVWPNPYFHTMAIESLLRRYRTHTISDRSGLGLALVWALLGVLGCAAGVRAARRSGAPRGRSLAVGVALCVGSLIILGASAMALSYGAYVKLDLLWTPWYSILACVLAGLATITWALVAPVWAFMFPSAPLPDNGADQP